MLWNAPPIWAGGKCFIIGGGLSVPRLFGVPENLIQKVTRKELEPTEYSGYLRPLHSKHIIGVNNAYQLGDWVDILFFGDCSWYLQHRFNIMEFPGIRVTCCPRFVNNPKHKGIKYLSKSSNHNTGISPKRTEVSWNQNSGAASINLAVHFGVKQVVLLGFDMRLDSSGVSHWHGSHTVDGGKPPVPPFARHMRGFQQIAKDAKCLGVEILNASPESCIDVFPKVNIKDFLYC